MSYRTDTEAPSSGAGFVEDATRLFASSFELPARTGWAARRGGAAGCGPATLQG